ncbi:MAG: SIS domain-containing protein [Candidatus Asgardarchaeia archaeon]
MKFSNFLKKTKENIKSQRKYVRDIINRESEIKGIAQGLSDLNIKEILTTGCGDSYFAAIAGEYFLEKYTETYTKAVQAFEFVNHYRSRGKESAIICFSASGRTPLTLKAAKKAKSNGMHVIAITNFENSPLAQISDVTFSTNVKDAFGPPTVVSTTAVLAILILAINYGMLSKQSVENDTNKAYIQLKQLPNFVDKIYERTDIMENNMNFAADTRSIKDFFIIGTGPGYISALFTQAKFKEMSWVHSEAVMLEEFCHYGLIPVDEKSAVILLDISNSGKGKLKMLIQFLKEKGISTYYVSIKGREVDNDAKYKISFDDGLDDEFYIIQAMIPMQFLAIHLALEREQLSEEFRYGSTLSTLISLED